MKFDPETDFVRFRVYGYSGPEGRGWQIVDQLHDERVAIHPTGNRQHTAHLRAQADAARRNLAHFEETHR